MNYVRYTIEVASPTSPDGYPWYYPTQVDELPRPGDFVELWANGLRAGVTSRTWMIGVNEIQLALERWEHDGKPAWEKNLRDAGWVPL